MTKNEKLTDGEIMAEIMVRPVVPIWPHAARAYGISRGAAYAAAQAGEIETIRIGRLLKAITAPMRRRLHIDGGAS
jgi:hypothetical protein